MNKFLFSALSVLAFCTVAMFSSTPVSASNGGGGEVKGYVYADNDCIELGGICAVIVAPKL